MFLGSRLRDYTSMPSKFVPLKVFIFQGSLEEKRNIRVWEDEGTHLYPIRQVRPAQVCHQNNWYWINYCGTASRVNLRTHVAKILLIGKPIPSRGWSEVECTSSLTTVDCVHRVTCSPTVAVNPCGVFTAFLSAPNREVCSRPAFLICEKEKRSSGEVIWRERRANPPPFKMIKLHIAIGIRNYYLGLTHGCRHHLYLLKWW